ncbi:tryptophan 7-halogenase [Sphingomonas rhizophila]|uniref:Tryptophan 7-halogenase n=1 Tax=Sphingomonas rhizophila TaxID=2071607 RepID=A0A7G9SBD2_9SPHN|nr:tryptophan halogenase family protein [Sphingomonas rhizophila]QNN65157.1 tryptophan 7-halogenase [Sphingomonas rhizophila]
MSREDQIRRIVIVGGGTAGWMTAAALSRFLGGGRRRIILIESDAIGTVGVGEGTIPPILEFNRSLGIDEREFLRATKASYKLGISFDEWLEPGHRYFHQFGDIGHPLEGSALYQLWLKHRSDSRVGPLDDYSMSGAAAAQCRFAWPTGQPNSPLNALSYAFHFDASLYGQFLRGFAEARGVERIEGRIVEIHRDGETGDVAAVSIEGERKVRGDLFVDCSGFRSMLLGETLGVPFQDWSHWLPCDRAAAVPSARTDPMTPFTRSTARPAGWQWRIPLQHRTGNGHVYSSAHMSDDEAERLLLESLDGEPIAAVNRLRFKAGRRERSWAGNVVGIGLSSGFLEPLESTSIHLIQRGIQKLIALFPDRRSMTVERDEYNRHMVESYEPIRDFIILHYKANRRTEPFWVERREMAVPDSLQHKLDLWAEHGRVFRYNEELFDISSWVAVMIGQGLIPRGIDPVADALPDAGVLSAMTELRAAYADTARSMPSASEFIDRAVAS